ncbi:uncharacterized protein LOC123974123 isoform X2 [Micropterus dolomieu]|uniref:uncharacterized protein LOC123974123 isoform X2 n=1 Tax=Micropterus dolomieu TaxID=147949 RepID=UPI001E8E58AF|nr:uncharacterized protein LOC123974123 isoform X2 [Micropterus dolomieu]
MLKLVLLFLTLSGLQAVPLALPRRLQRTTYRLPDGFRQGTEPSRRFLVDLNTGLVQEHITEMDRRVAFIQPSLGNGFGEMERRHWLTDKVPLDVPAQKNGGGWIRVEEPSASHIPDGFRQGTEPKMSIPDGFRQGTEPKMSIPDGFRQGTEPKMSASDGLRLVVEHVMSMSAGFSQGTEPVRKVPEGFRQGTEPSLHLPEGFRQGTEPVSKVPEGFRQGTEPSLHLPDGFRQGTEPVRKVPEGFRQGTEPSLHLPEGFRQGTEPFMSIPDVFRQGTEPILKIPEGFKQGTEPSTSGLQTKTVACKGEVINENCYEFNPTPLAFEDAQVLCRALAPNAELASITSGDLHSRLVSLVTNGGESNPVLTWLGGMVKNQQASWVDGSEWRYSDWMPGHPNIHTDKPVCVEMFKIDESWWTAVDCELKRASICSYPISA